MIAFKTTNRLCFNIIYFLILLNNLVLNVKSEKCKYFCYLLHDSYHPLLQQRLSVKITLISCISELNQRITC